MAILIGIDLGTTTITALALDGTMDDVLARVTRPNRAETTSPADKARGRSEWDARQIAEAGFDCLRDLAGQLGERRNDVLGIGITGQQHGVVVVDNGRNPLTPLVNWQDRRGDDRDPETGLTFTEHAMERVGADIATRTGCRLASGYLAVTLFWMKETRSLPSGTACFLMDYFGSLLVEKPPVTDPTCAASSGILEVRRADWDAGAITALGLPREMFPPVRPSGDLLGSLSPALAEAIGLPAKVPVFAGIGDNQASFLGSVADRHNSVLVNVGTGGQVAAWTDPFTHDPALETRPFPHGGYLLVCAGLTGGRAYAVLEQFFRAAGERLFGLKGTEPLYARLNELAGTVSRGADGLRCEPFFTGTRREPNLRGTWSGVSPENFTPGHMARAMLEGMARTFRAGRDVIMPHLTPAMRHLVGAGNGVRENPLLARIIAEEFGQPLVVPAHREEAAFGAALIAAVGAGACPDLAAAGQWIRYASPGADAPSP